MLYASPTLCKENPLVLMTATYIGSNDVKFATVKENPYKVSYRVVKSTPGFIVLTVRLRNVSRKIVPCYGLGQEQFQFGALISYQGLHVGDSQWSSVDSGIDVIPRLPSRTIIKRLSPGHSLLGTVRVKFPISGSHIRWQVYTRFRLRLDMQEPLQYAGRAALLSVEGGWVQWKPHSLQD
jgi:hypothetical protein